MPNAVILLSSDGEKLNLSDEAYAAFKEPEATIVTSVVSGQFKLLRAAGPTGGLGAETSERRPRSSRPPTNVTLKEQLDASDVEEILAEQSGWKLAVPTGSATDVLTRDALAEAWRSNATGVVTMSLRGPTMAEQGVLDDAKERFTPKAGWARVSAALGAPVAQIALLAVAFGGFFGWKGDEIARPTLLYLAGGCALLAVITSIVSTYFLGRSKARLSRLDQLELLSRPSRLTIWTTRTAIGLFVAALVIGFLAVIPPDSSSQPSPSFSTQTTTDEGTGRKVTFTVTWTDLPSTLPKVRTTVAGGSSPQAAVTPATKGMTTQNFEVPVDMSTTALIVRTQALDSMNRPAGDLIEHTYTVP
jgi:hypothetical protein